METLKENIITVENIKEEIEKADLMFQEKMRILVIAMIDYMQNGLSKD